MKDAESLLGTIRSPEDLKKLDSGDLPGLAAEIRHRIIDVVTRNGGHLASSLGVVELTIALHRVFTSPDDKIIWDVGHQAYAHKILTGRNDTFDTIRQKNGLSGFPKPSESPHDIVETGHSSTSVSAALGLRIGSDLQQKNGWTIAVIGDGSATAGMSFEGLNHMGHLGSRVIVVLNDNNMSISPNVGAMAAYLSRLTITRFYQKFWTRLESLIVKFPGGGKRLMMLAQRFKRAVKAVLYKETLFSDLGFKYVGPVDGHDIRALTDVLRLAGRQNSPVVVHVVSVKGKGCEEAEGNPTKFHGVSAVAPVSALDKGVKSKGPSVPTFTQTFAQLMEEEGGRNSQLTAVSAAMLEGTGLSGFQQAFPQRCFDVGIAEQHAVTFASGLARTGLRPVVAVYSTFMQRAVDQVIHDIAIPGLPVVIAMDRAGIVGPDGETHQGVFDIPLFRTVPGLTFLAPGNRYDMEWMFRFAFKAAGPVMIRYPKGSCREIPAVSDYQPESMKGRGYFVRREEASALIVAVGGLLEEAVKASEIAAQKGLGCDIYNLCYIKPFDYAGLSADWASYDTILIVEEGAENGGIGEHLCDYFRDRLDIKKMGHKGCPDLFIPHATRREILQELGLDCFGLASAVESLSVIHRTS